MNTLKKYKISIFGESYTVVSDESEEHLTSSAQRVDTLMRQIAEKSGISDSKRIAVLAALQCATQLKTCELLIDHYECMETKLSTCIDRELSSSSV